MRILYVSPSTIPSRSANSIHVINMCDAFSEEGHEVVLFAARTFPNKKEGTKRIRQHYGLNLSKVSFCSFFSKSQKQINLKIALMALFWILLKKENNDIIFTRNLYFAFLWTLVSKTDFFYETHQPESHFRKKLQQFVFRTNKCTIVSISDALTRILHQASIAHPYNKIMTLHDCAPLTLSKWTPNDVEKFKTQALQSYAPKGKKLVGYFGHLYKGRGIEIVEQLAQRIPEASFFVFGGNDEEIIELKRKNNSSNLHIMGYVLPHLAHNYMRAMNVLLMPYQQKVFISSQNDVDTSQWMSPMKMFEYMASNVPIISSDLPVLREVLCHEKNALLVPPNDVDSWQTATQKLIRDEKLSALLANKAREDFEHHYTWKRRAQSILNSNHTDA